MMVMAGRVEPLRRMALRAYGVAGFVQLARMRVMAVGARYAGGIHPALNERSVVEHLFALLAVGIIEPRLQGRGLERIEEIP